MSGGQRRRFGRGSRAISGAHVTIEREKIRRPQANELVFDKQSVPPKRSSYRADAGNRGFAQHPYDAAYEPEDMADWQGAEEVEEIWDEENEEDWTLADDDQQAASDYDQSLYADDGYDGQELSDEARYGEGNYYGEEDDQGGVVWDDAAFTGPGAVETPDEVAFGRQNRSLGSDPEVELAGRRDVRPKPPRPAPPPRPSTPLSQPRAQRKPPRDQGALAPPPGFSSPRPTGPTASGAPFDGGRAGLALDDEDDEVLQQPMQGKFQRRRAHPPPGRTGKPPRAAARRRGGGMVSASTILILALLAGVGWFGYQAISRTDLQPIVDRLSTLIPLPGSTRGAADTSFADAGNSDAGSAERALSDLERRIQQQDGGGLAAGSTPAAVNGQTSGTDGPPIPQLKPVPGAAGSSSLTDQRQVAANGGRNDGEEAGEPSLFEQLWRYINPG